MTFLIYPILTASLYYLGSRAKVTSWLWSRYPHRFASFMDCAACTGFWYGLILSATVGRYADVRVGSFPASSLVTPIVVAFACIVSTPLVAALHHLALNAIGSAVPDQEPDPDGIPSDNATDTTLDVAPAGVKTMSDTLDLHSRF